MTGFEPPPPPPARKSERPSMRPGGPTSLLGTTIGGRYRIDTVLGEGGMGTVYAAEHLLMRKRVALKVLHPDMSRVAEIVARFEREAMAAGHIDHPNVAAATDFGQLPDGSFFLVLELVEGQNLRNVIELGHLSVKRAVHIAQQITSALSRAHALGVVHRDLKPDNVMLITRGNDPDFVKVLDFGIAKVPMLDVDNPSPSSAASIPMSSSPKVLTKMGMVYGTPEYMAPEQALGQAVDGRADLYAVGILLFEMLTGRRPFDHDNMATLLGLQVTAPVPAMSTLVPNVRVPAAVEAVVRRLLAKDPAERFAAAEDLEAALEEVSFAVAPTEFPPSDSFVRGGGDAHNPLAPSAPPSVATPAPASGEPAARPSPRRAWIGAALVVGLASLALLVRAASSPSDGAPRSALEGSSAVQQVPSAAPPPSSTTPTSPATPPTTSPASDPVASALAEADTALANAKPAMAIAALAPLEAANQENVPLHHGLERAYAMSHDRAAALHEAEAWLSLDASATSDLALQADIGEIATHPASSDAAIALLASQMGAPGVDILYDLAYASKQAPTVSSRAKATLADPSVRAHAGPAAAILLDLRAATTCDAKKALLVRAKSDGDRRALPVLQPWTTKRGGGACMRGDADLTDAISAVRGRAGRL